MRKRIWSLKVTNAVTSYALDTSAPSSPLRSERETTIVLERGTGKDQEPQISTHSSVKISHSIAPMDWLVIAMMLTGGAVLPVTGIMAPNTLGIPSETWMLIGFVMMFTALPIYAESGKDKH